MTFELWHIIALIVAVVAYTLFVVYQYQNVDGDGMISAWRMVAIILLIVLLVPFCVVAYIPHWIYHFFKPLRYEPRVLYRKHDALIRKMQQEAGLKPHKRYYHLWRNVYLDVYAQWWRPGHAYLTRINWRA